MKKTIATCLMLSTLLCGCQRETGQANVPQDPQSTQGTEAHTNTQAPTPSEDDTRLAYYEQLVNELQQKVLDLKTELYASRVEYEAQIDALREQVSSKPPASGETTDDKIQTDTSQESEREALFSYIVKDGAATLTAYRGSDKRVIIPSSLDGYRVVAIADRAFADHAEMVSVVIPEGVTSIGWFAFSGCVSLQTVAIPASVTSISYGAFQNCDAKMTVACASGSYAEQYARSYGMAVKK